MREANVNLATEQAHVVYDPDTATLDALRAAVEKAGSSGARDAVRRS